MRKKESDALGDLKIINYIIARKKSALDDLEEGSEEKTKIEYELGAHYTEQGETKRRWEGAHSIVHSYLKENTVLKSSVNPRASLDSTPNCNYSAGIVRSPVVTIPPMSSLSQTERDSSIAVYQADSEKQGDDQKNSLSELNQEQTRIEPK